MSRRLTAGNDAPFVWVVKVQGQPFDLSGKDVKVYVINSRGEIPVASLNIEGNRVSGVFEGRYQTRLGGHSLILRINEGRPEMMTASVSNVFDLVQWSADAGGYDEGDVIIAPVVISSELRIGSGEGGGSYDDTAIWEALNDKVDKEEGKGLSTNDYTDEEREKLAGLENYDDTKLKEEIAKTYATKEYVDEAVGNAGGGGEGCECATPDWSAEEGEQGHILNRPCYYELSEMNILETLVMVGSPYLTTMYGGDLFRFKVLGETFDIDLSGKEIPTYDYNTDIQHKLSYTFDIDTIRVSVDFYDAGDGALTMEFGYVANEGESAPDELTLYVAEYVVNGRQRLSEGLIPQTIARTSELTELSAEVGDKQDTITDLETIRNGAAKGATALQSVPDTYATKDYVDNAIKDIPQGGGEPSQYIKDASKSADGSTLTLTKKDGSIVSFSPSGGGGGGSSEPSGILAALYRNGVISQDLNREGNANIGYKSVMSNPVYGIIPKQFIDQVWDQYAVRFNEQTGYFEYADITNLAYDEVMRSVSLCNGLLIGTDQYNLAQPPIFFISGISKGGNYDKKLRTLLIPRIYVSEDWDLPTSLPNRWKIQLSKNDLFLEIGLNSPLFPQAQTSMMCYMCQHLRKAGNFYFDANTNMKNAFAYCYSLEEIGIKALSASLDFHWSPLLNYSSIRIMIAESKASNNITLTLHPTALTNAETAYLADTTQDLVTYPTLTDWALSKKIQLATA